RGIKSVKKSAKFQRQLKRMIRTEDPDGFKQECSTCKKRKEPSRNTVELSEQSKSSSEIEDSSSTMENWCLEPCKRSGQIPSWKIKRIRSGKSSVNDQASDRNEKLKAIKNPRKRSDRTESTDDDELSRSSAPSPMDVKESVELKRTRKRKNPGKRPTDLTESEYLGGPCTNLRTRVREMARNKKRKINLRNKRRKMNKRCRKISAEADVSSNMETDMPESFTSTPIIDSVLIESFEEKQKSGEEDISVEDLEPTPALMDVPEEFTSLPTIESDQHENSKTLDSEEISAEALETSDMQARTVPIGSPNVLPQNESVQLQKPKTLEYIGKNAKMTVSTTPWIDIPGPSTPKNKKSDVQEIENRIEISKETPAEELETPHVLPYIDGTGPSNTPVN
ncbi:hypothetical protein TNCT_345521, partial [Trichonephila clavata]